MPIYIKPAFVLILLVTLWASLYTNQANLGLPTMMSLGVFGTALIAWCFLDVDELWIGLLACLALVITKIMPQGKLFDAFASELTWLMLAAFVMSAAVQVSGLADRFIMWALGSPTSFYSLVMRVTGLVALSALIVPSTSARAALFVPVMLALLPTLRDLGQDAVRCLALAIVSSILLSAGAVLTGAGAHLLAVQFLTSYGVDAPSFMVWLAMHLPLALASTYLASWILLTFFTKKSTRQQIVSAQLRVPQQTKGCTLPQQRYVGTVIAFVVLGWCFAGMVQVSMAVVGLLGVVALAITSLSGLALKKLLKSVEWSLLLFLAVAAALGQNLIDTGASQLLSNRFGQAFDTIQISTFALTWIVGALAVVSHCFITSRSARILVLLPALVTPLLNSDLSIGILAMLCVQGSGFCQAFKVSAKPVMIFGAIELTPQQPLFNSTDLLKLALPLAPLFLCLLVASANLWWPLWME
jgi:solute carrier family 13 (sodium-dependent dicarboxylate transporter), member 2/3/5